jgi:predicted metal-dependent hydrolase
MYPDAYILFLVEFHSTRDYFECHEILEDHWKEAPSKERDPVWPGLIQIAVGLYHERRGNLTGASKCLKNAGVILRPLPRRLQALGLDAERLLQRIEEQLDRLGEPFRDLNLPITDPKLEAQCIRLCEQKKTSWLQPSPLEDTDLVHKHVLRDRTDIVHERDKQLRIRDKQRRSRGL